MLDPMLCLRDLFFVQAEDGIRVYKVTGVQTCALPICLLDEEIRVARLVDGDIECSRVLATVVGRAQARDREERERLRRDEVLAANLHRVDVRSEEHTSELQSPCNLVCRLLLETKKHYALLDQRGEARDPLPALYTPAETLRLLKRVGLAR